MSLRTRIVLVATAVVAIFLVLTGIALDQAFRESALTARQERLQGQLYLVIGAAEVTEDGLLTMPQRLSEPRFGQPGSGLYATIEGPRGKEVWRSLSALNVALPAVPATRPGDGAFTREERFFVSRMGVKWTEGRKSYAFVFRVAEDLAPFQAQLKHYRNSLWGWLAAMAALLLGAQAFLLHWGLRPLRRVAREIRAIQSGKRERLGEDYPAELRALTENLNGLLQRERAQQQRYRDALGDLAHSLKTPLAVIRGALAEVPDDARLACAATIGDETERMQHIVDYQLQRAATAGPTSRLAAPVAIAELAERLLGSLDKVYRDKRIRAEMEMADGLSFRVDRGDLMELLGNLLDNAYKWGATKVRFGAVGDGATLRITVEDDGPGIPPHEAERILQRGARADQATPGQGIGLAVVASIVQAYRGEIRIGTSALGGAAIEIRLRG